MRKPVKMHRWVVSILLWVLSVGQILYAQTPTVDLTAHQSAASPPAGATLEWHTALPVSATNLVSGTLTSAATPGVYYAVYSYTSCYSQPSYLRILTNTCPSTDVDLRTGVELTSIPANATVTFHSSATVSASNELSSATVTTSSAETTYYAAYKTYDASTSSYCYSGASPIVVVQTSCCSNAAAGGTITFLGTLPLCSLSNAGSFTLTGHTGTVLRWETSTDGGASFSAISGTSAKAFYTFVNAANGQQFRAKVSPGASCSALISSTVVITTDPNACTAAACDNTSGIIALSSFSVAVGSNLISQLIAITPAGTIQYVSSPGTFTLTGVTPGNYIVYVVTHDNTQSPLPTLTVGTALSAVGGACVKYSNQLLYTICPGIAILAPTNNGITTTSPLVSGTASPGSLITLTDPTGATLCSTTATASGSWSCAVNLSPGSTTLTATACTSVGCSTATSSFTAVTPSSLTIITPNGEIVASNNPPIRGLATPGASVSVLGPNGQLCTTVADPISGTYSCTSLTFVDGSASVTALAGSVNGSQASTAVVSNFTVVIPPSLAILTPGNNGTATTSPLVSGTATPGSLITLTDPTGATLCSTTATAGGSWSCAVNVAPGSTTLTATACTTVGCAIATTSFTAANPTSLTLAPTGPETGTSLIVSGTATPGSQVVITGPTGATLCSTTANAVSGTFACPVTVPPGSTTLTAVACTSAGCSTATQSFTAVDPGSVAILSPANNGTATTSPLVSGTAAPGSLITLTDPTGATLCSTTATASGSWSCVVSVVPGSTTLTAVACTSAGCTTATTSFTAANPTSLTLAPTGPETGTSLVVSGTATPGSQVVITGPTGATLCSTTANAVSGTFACPVTVPPGSTTLTTVACKSAGCSTATQSFTALAPPTVAILSPANTTTQPAGVSVVSGTATPGSTVILTTSNGNSATITMGASNTYSVTMTPFPTGTNSVTATVSNPGGTATTTSTFTVAGPTALTLAQTGTGPLTQPLAGTATPGSQIMITGPGPVTLCTTTASASGTFSCPVTLTSGVTDLTVTASGPGGTTAQTISLTALASPTVAILSPATNGTATTAPTISGTATPLASVTVSGPNGQVCVTVASATGSWSCNSMTFATGANAVQAIAANPGGTSPQDLSAFNVISLPSLTVVTPPTGGTAQVISGTATPGSQIVITIPNPSGPGTLTLCTTTASISGTFACPVTVPTGPSTLTVTATGPAGSTSVPVNVSAIAQPTVAIDSPANNTTQPAGVNMVSGTATPGSTVTLTASNGNSVTALASPTGGFTATISGSFPAGTNSITVTSGDLGGPSTPAVSTFTVVAPPSLTIAPPVAGPLTQPLAGTATPGSQIVITGPGPNAGPPVTLCTTTASASGTFSCPVTLTAGVNNLTVTASTPGGTTSQPVILTGTSAPSVVINTPADNTTQPAGVNTVSGTATPGSTVTLTASNGDSVTALASPTGGFTATMPTAFTAGVNTITVTAGNPGGTSSPVLNTFTVAAPPSLTVTSPVNTSTTSTPTLAGTATPGSSIIITGPNPVGPGTVILCATTASSSGTFSCGPLTIPTGPNTLTITATGPGGTTAVPVSFTTVAPPTVAILSPADNTTQPAGVNVVSGTATPGSTVVLTTSNGNSATITMGASNTYSVTMTPFPTGTNGVTATVSNAGGTATTTSTFTVAGPTALTLAQTGTGPLTQPLAGTATPGSQIVITGPGPVTLCSTTASASGTFSCPVTLTSGVTNLTVTASGPGGTTAQTISLTALASPTIAILSPANNGTATTTPTISGTATPLASVTVGGPNGQVCITVASATGSWSCNSMSFTPGANVVTAIASNPGGTSPLAITPFTVFGLPSLTVVTPPTGGTAQVISGTATPGSQIVITIPNPSGPGTLTLCTTTASISGTFACPVTLPPGSTTMTVTAIGPGGSVSATTVFTVVAPPVVGIGIPVRVMLQGALTHRQFTAPPTFMRDDLRRLGLIPTTEPFTALGNAPVGGGSGMSIINPAAVLAVTGPNAIIDWVMVELRSTTAPHAVIASQPALVQADGDVVGMDGVSTVLFSQSGLAGGSYHVGIDHRNHIGVMTQNPITLTGLIPVVDFVNPATPVFKLAPSNLQSLTTTMATERGYRCLWAGDTNGDESVIFQGGNNDVTPIFFEILTDPANSGFLSNFVKSNAYLNTDVDMDGQVIFQGGNNEVDIIFFEIILHPENVNTLTNFILWGQIF